MGGSASCSSKVWPATVTSPPTGTMAKVRNAGRIDQVRRQLEDEPVALFGDQVLLEEQLDPVGQGLEEAEGARPVGADAALHVGDDLALEPDHQDHRHHQRGEGDHRP